MDFEQAKQAFELYLNGYDRKDEKVYLKIVHTYGVVDCSEEIARRMGLGEEDIFLEIGRASCRERVCQYV